VRQDWYPPLIRHLFSEHHVYVRGGSASRYVVLSWPWQIGVLLALAGVVVWTGLASYGWVATHLETLAQGRELTRLAQLNQRLEAAATSVPEQATVAPTTPTRLVIGLEEIKAGPWLALSLAEAAVVQVDDVGRDSRPAEADATVDDQKIGTLDARLAAQLLPAAIRVEESSSGRDWLYDRITRRPSDEPPHAAETIRLSAEIARLNQALRKAQAGAADR
jgi:hypothetical protein